jgi:hypothetical protein
MANTALMAHTSSPQQWGEAALEREQSFSRTRKYFGNNISRNLITETGKPPVSGSRSKIRLWWPSVSARKICAIHISLCLVAVTLGTPTTKIVCETIHVYMYEDAMASYLVV